ncbi:transcriptional regulator [Propionibacterium sp. NM47_B9-13]|uniref:Transcriptional regulator n=4 Tax=Bacteria TaxID=2 RepID=A0AA44ZF36_CUTAC|nr:MULTISPECIES: hypothetical protein [Cutibacterium]EFS93768.1 hypothetical protein HMPREF9607_00027 [Cutibacterium modestum HL044PA1]EFT16853.1 hypothetical protein HMPREF9622_00061 [Cutibacterium modestum HL037PA3]TGY27468.1 transcriptional regulator [Propionibacterium sp. NM47_B9-13]EFS74572.1 hypothetical protein HMPREF9621_01038 [Cutibacterium modestum HL037PA2]PGF40176.1 transcriptional regulator [Cutibacterium acnes subsp. defendens]
MKISSSCELSSYLPLNQLVWHEECETLRLKRLTKLLEHEALRESIHVAQGAPYIILDGAHRCRAAFYLGFDSIPAHVVPMAPEQSVSGWVHVYNTRKFSSMPPLVHGEDRGSTIAILHDGDLRQEVHSKSDLASDLFYAYWDLAELLGGFDYRRSADVPAQGQSVEWVLPSWGAIAKIATNYGPLPAGITRFGSVFFKKCPRCIAEHEKSIMSDPVLDRDEVKSLAVMKD